MIDVVKLLLLYIVADDSSSNFCVPNILIKGSDYNKENIIGKEYVNEVILFNYVNNKSSTNVINKIKNI